MGNDIEKTRNSLTITTQKYHETMLVYNSFNYRNASVSYNNITEYITHIIPVFLYVSNNIDV